MNTTLDAPLTTPAEFVEAIERAGLWACFAAEYGPSWQADEDYHDGWFFEANAINYRACRLFDDYADGYNWRFERNDPLAEVLLETLQAAGFEVAHNSGDEEDGYLRLERSPL